MKFLLFGLLLLGLSAHTQNETPAQSPSKAPLRVLCFGDSITAGSALPKEEKPLVWPLLVEKYSEGKLSLINEGKGGRSTNSVREFEAVLEKHPDFNVLLIALGTNDSRDITEKCVPSAVENIKRMIDLARKGKANLPVFVVGPPNINKNALGPTKPIANQREQKLKELNEGFDKLAKENACNFVSLFGIVPGDCLQRDGVHPDAKGNEAIAEVIAATLMPPENKDK